MDPGGIGALIGTITMVLIGIGVCVYDRYYYKKQAPVSNPLLVKKRSFKVKNLFNHVEI